MARDIDGTESHRVVTREQWLTARQALLAKEKEFTRLRDELSRERRALPWEKVDKTSGYAGTMNTIGEEEVGHKRIVHYHLCMTDPRARDGGAAEPAGRLVNAGDIELAWGRASEWKAYLRAESLRRHLDRPLAERLRSALSLVLADERTREPRST